MPTLSPEAIASLRKLEANAKACLDRAVSGGDAVADMAHNEAHARFAIALVEQAPALLDAAETHATLTAFVAKLLAWNPEQAGSADLREALHRHRMGLIEALATLDRSAK